MINLYKVIRVNKMTKSVTFVYLTQSKYISIIRVQYVYSLDVNKGIVFIVATRIRVRILTFLLVSIVMIYEYSFVKKKKMITNNLLHLLKLAFISR